MSRDLPSRPNLEHLKKQAKDLLDTLRRRNPEATLTAAQHALAREYGFVSWRRLKAHVEALARIRQPAAAGPLGFERYTQTLRRVVFFSRYEAAWRGSPNIESEHVLLGMIRDSGTVARRILDTAQVSVDGLRSAIDAGSAAAEPRLQEQIPFSRATRDVLRRTLEEADRLQHHSITTGHLLVGLLADETFVAAVVLRQAGLHVHTVRGALAQLANDEQ